MAMFDVPCVDAEYCVRWGKAVMEMLCYGNIDPGCKQTCWRVREREMFFLEVLLFREECLVF